MQSPCPVLAVNSACFSATGRLYLEGTIQNLEGTYCRCSSTQCPQSIAQQIDVSGAAMCTTLFAIATQEPSKKQGKNQWTTASAVLNANIRKKGKAYGATQHNHVSHSPSQPPSAAAAPYQPPRRPAASEKLSLVGHVRSDAFESQS